MYIVDEGLYGGTTTAARCFFGAFATASAGRPADSGRALGVVDMVSATEVTGTFNRMTRVNDPVNQRFQAALSQRTGFARDNERLPQSQKADVHLAYPEH